MGSEVTAGGGGLERGESLSVVVVVVGEGEVGDSPEVA